MTDAEKLSFEGAAELLRALGHGVRLALLRALIGGERSVREIEQITGVGQPGLSQQLGVLRKADLVITRREAKLVFYRINHARIAEVRALLDVFAGTMTPPREEPAAARMERSGGGAVFARVEPRR